MSNFVPESDDLKKSAAKSHRMLFEAYGDHSLSEATCRDNNFDVRNKKHLKTPNWKQYWIKMILSQKQMEAMHNKPF